MGIYEEEQELIYLQPRKREEVKESKANSKRAELLERTLQFLGPDKKGKPRSPKAFGSIVCWLKDEDLEYMLSVSKAWQKNPRACWWSIFNKNKPK